MAWYLLSSARNLGKFKNKKEVCIEAKRLLDDNRKSYHPTKKVPSFYEYVSPKENKTYDKLYICTKKSAKAEGFDHLLEITI